MTDVLIAGGGISGSALAILLARQGLRVELFERAEFPREKACGEGLMPAGVGVLTRLGVKEAVGGVPFSGIRYHFRGASVTGVFPPSRESPSRGIAQRRAVLDRVLFETAAASPGVRARTRAVVQSPLVEGGRVTGLLVDGEAHRAPLVVAADGVRSPLRRALGFERSSKGRRIGMRAHFRLTADAEPSPWVDVFLGERQELYVTSLPGKQLLVALLMEGRALDGSPETAFRRSCFAHPLLAERLRGAEQVTSLRGVSPLSAGCRRGFAPGIVLLGDAAGSIDPITGGGMTHALQSAELLAEYAQRLIQEGGGWLAEFDRRRRALLLDYALLTEALLRLSGHPRWIEPALRVLRSRPSMLSHLVGVAAGIRPLLGTRTRGSAEQRSLRS